MIKCDQCGSVLLADGTCTVCGRDHQQASDSSSGSNATGSEADVSQSITVEGSGIDGAVTNEVVSDVSESGDQSISVTDSRVEGEVSNYRGPNRTGVAAELTADAVSELEQRREELLSAVSADDVDTVTQLLAVLDDASAISTLRDMDSSSGTATTGAEHPAADPIPVAHTLDALAEVDRLASEGTDLDGLYVAIEKTVRLLSGLETPVEEELKAFVDRQRALTEGSIFDEELSPDAQATVKTLCDRARDAVAKQAQKTP